MKKLILFLSALFCLLLFSCSTGSPEDEGADDGLAGGSEDEWSEAEEFGPEDGAIDCEGDGYTLYLDGCPGDHQGAGSASSFAGQSHTGQKRPLDILFILDTSASMEYYYRYSSDGFETRFKDFVPSLGETDYRLLVTNSDFGLGFWGGKNGKAFFMEEKDGLSDTKFLDRSTYSWEVFRNTITNKPDRSHEEIHGGSVSHSDNNRWWPPYAGSREYPLRALQASFTQNQSLTREEADLVAIIVSNADEHAHKKSPEPTAETILNAFKQVYGDQKKLYLLNLIILPGDGACLQENDKLQFWFKESQEGQKIAQVAKELGGGNFSICLKDYSIVAETILRLSTQ